MTLRELENFIKPFTHISIPKHGLINGDNKLYKKYLDSKVEGYYIDDDFGLMTVYLED